MDPIPQFVVEYFLLGKTRRDAMERYTQDGGVGTDVWLAFAADQDKPQRVLIAPSLNSTTMMVASAVHQAVMGYRASRGSDILNRDKPNVSPLENFVAATIFFDELLRVVLPLTTWWHRRNLSALSRKASRSGASLEERLEQAIMFKLGHEGNGAEVAFRKSDEPEEFAIPDQRILQAAPVAALIGVFRKAHDDPSFLAGVEQHDPRRSGSPRGFIEWVGQHARDIAAAARVELARQFERSVVEASRAVVTKSSNPDEVDNEPVEIVQRVFLDRKAVLADADALSTIKADAAKRLFEVSCSGITWAVIDSGIATTHPAFEDHDIAAGKIKKSAVACSRVRATFDFTRIELIRNYDLTLGQPGSPERNKVFDKVIGELKKLPGRNIAPTFDTMARTNLELIAAQLERRLPPDWNLIEPLLRLEGDDGGKLVSDHGTHVAGTLGGDWLAKVDSQGKRNVILRGVCPDINLYDMRVIHESSRQSSEFALLAALEFIRFMNDRAGPNGPVVAGVNISLSIPYDVRTYGCGATPVCVASDKLVDSGVVVVVAAGNRGWNEEEIGFGSFVFCSITDPGNAREVVTVGSTHRLKPHLHGVSYFSSRGPTGDGRAKPDLVAPGEKIRGPVRGDSDDELDGTSMAAPFVSGAAAILLARHSELIGDPRRVKKILCDSATDLGREKYFQGHGLVDVLRALQSI